MDESAQSFSPSYSQPESPRIYLGKPSGSTSSGLTLVLPSLKSLKASQTARQPKHLGGSRSRAGSIPQDVDLQEKKIPRPVKLKPLKEVLTKLITQLKKKDDYAFFLTPVDVANVPGYSDIVKYPMDLGTMATKVNRGKYRSLDDFTADFRLVTRNAKMFNPPGTIYYAEAERLETWGLDHINRAAGTVIQYETDWNIEIEKDDEGSTVNVDDDIDERVGTPMDVDLTSFRERSLSAVSQPQPGPSRRGPRGPYKKQGQTTNGSTLSEALDVDGGLPGSKDGIGAFPPRSDWAKTMLALKLKGKRYKTKKERMRVEREGPPVFPDGSLDYTEMEDPFSVLSFFVPDPISRPHLVPLYPPVYSPPQHPTVPQTPSDILPSQIPQPPPPPLNFPSATTIPTDHAPPSLLFSQSDNSGSSNRRRHWTIIRNPSSRQKGKEREDESETPELPAWQMPREAHAVDFGSFALLAGELAEEMRRRGMTSDGTEKECVDQEVTFDLIRSSLGCETAVKNKPELQEASPSAAGAIGSVDSATLLSNGYFTSRRAAEAEEYVRDMVYGGVDGLAYVRSLAEFVSPSKLNLYSHLPPISDPHISQLGMPLAKWVEQNIVDPLTEGRHALLQETARELSVHHTRKANAKIDGGTVASQVFASLHIYPAALISLLALLHIRLHKIDMASLIKTPEELFLSEEEWAGKGLKEKRKLKRAQMEAQNPPSDAMEVEEPEQTWVGVDASVAKDLTNGRVNDYELEGPEELNEVLDYVAGVIVELDRKREERATSKKLVNGHNHSLPNGTKLAMKQEDEMHDDPPPEDPILRNLRLNLLALAKRAPLDTIARLPKDLVPEHIRHIVPMLSSRT